MERIKPDDEERIVNQNPVNTPAVFGIIGTDRKLPRFMSA